MISSNMGHLRIVASGAIIDKVHNELRSNGIKHERSPMCFSASSTPEFVEIALPIATSMVGAIVAIVAARIGNRKVRVKLKNHPHIEEIEAGNPDDLKKVINQIDEIYLSDH